MSASRDLVTELLAAGMSKADIARAVGRDSSVISQITSGKKPYANLVPTLAALRDQRRGQAVPVPSAPRRTAKDGKAAKTRGKTSFAGGRIIRVKKQAAKSGARSIGRQANKAAAAGARVAFTVTYPGHVSLSKSGQRPGPGGERTQTVELGNKGNGFSAERWAQRISEANGDVGKALTDYLVRHNLLDTPDVTPLAIEMRTWMPDDDAAPATDPDDE